MGGKDRLIETNNIMLSLEPSPKCTNTHTPSTQSVCSYLVLWIISEIWFCDSQLAKERPKPGTLYMRSPIVYDDENACALCGPPYLLRFICTLLYIYAHIRTRHITQLTCTRIRWYVMYQCTVHTTQTYIILKHTPPMAMALPIHNFKCWYGILWLKLVFADGNSTIR